MVDSKPTYTVFQIHQWVTKHFDLSIKDDSVNGIQIQNLGFVTKIISAVDASLELLEKTCSYQTLYLVHHGVFWDAQIPIVNPSSPLTKKLLSLDSALYALHLPLDAHPFWGNNALIAKQIGLTNIVFGGFYKGTNNIIAIGELPTPQNREQFADFLEEKIGKLHFLFHGPSTVRNIGICSGGGLFGIHQAKKLGFDSLITGDMSHTAYHLSKELQVNVFSCGHYATEVFGVQHMGNLLSATLGIDHEFFDLPTRL